jgi:hypothetical protein
VPPRARSDRDRRRNYADALNRLNFAIKRDLRRAALFLWMIPLPATRSSILTASLTAAAAAAGSPARIANSAFLTYVRAAVRNGRFRCRRRSETRMRFSADLLFAKAPHLNSIASSAAGTPNGSPPAVSKGWYQTKLLGTTADSESGRAP